ncbi:DUF6323 family protein [Clostridium folliculivorans]|uniref:Uncharacterized protein n=1 Tax=Clostridium folliculivorans TaxID=2886038 RepID=A0A9W6D9B9_9CLOT|nr:DUF6323 family protein [Clostridium folliculivorans]GKU24150.1 hypothetical protein CFOLD11_09760 [Clostridium folliculivorans]GKU30256.1 hypothetical protein CFB3_23630 [Clostridium folliculivorans]
MEKSLMFMKNSILTKQTLSEIQQINEETLEYGLKLSENDIKAILETRNNALSSNGRVEFGGGLVKKIITAFCDSPFIHQQNYVESITDLVDAFYYFKNETLEEISDDDLIEFMKECFNDKCQGDLDLLRYRYLYQLVHNVRYGANDYLKEDMEEYMDDYMNEEGYEE